MGVPKFFKFISERYPCLSELVKEYQIPEFDNLYLDMNGIIHMCSHPDDNDPHFRITEEKIFKDIFHYIEVLFRMIKPQKLFFMAVDGVAPRAKMNQQRSRRFRTAKEAEKLEQKAKEKGEVLPEGNRFDSNCITPGTVFMAQLQEQLQYFVVNKISMDPLWQSCKIILSGHETPGEGEHKIMDYIRYERSQPGYDPNTRHCLYGLDADLIMLGLCTHEPHFSLLREEVKFGKKNDKRSNVPEQITFYLLHLSLMREYLEQEFIVLKDKLSFDFNLDNIIDDWVLMGFLVGNDFIPHLPNLHIANGALPILYEAYKKVMPTFDGYINEGGNLNLERFEKFMEALCSIDLEQFNEHYADLKYFESKTGRRPNEKERTSYKPKKLEDWQPDEDADDSTFGALEGEIEKPMNPDLAALIKRTEEMALEPSEKNLQQLADESDDIDEEDAEVIMSDNETSPDEDDLMQIEFQSHKRDYYMNKMQYEQVTPEVMRSQAEGYVRAIQWNLNYYYNGVCSWSWYYEHHYAPFISDIKNFKNFKIDFELGKPFNPYEQLLAVLPTASKKHLPACYHRLMEDPNSPIFDYYPVNFNTDLNGKKQDWEAVVIIPFIDEKRLLTAMATVEHELTAEEVKRNKHGPMLIYEYTTKDLGEYEAPEYFQKVSHSHALCVRKTNEDIRVPPEKLIKGAYPGVLFDVYYPGFPTMKHLKYRSYMDKAGVKVFDQPSRGENMILELEPRATPKDPLQVAEGLLGKTVFVSWPHLIEAIVVSISTKDLRYHCGNIPEEPIIEENKGNVRQNWHTEKKGIIEYYSDKRGVIVGETDILVHCKLMIGRKYVFTAQGRMNLEKQWSDTTNTYPYQTIVENINSYDPTYKPFYDVEDIFTVGSSCYMLGIPYYGYMGVVEDSKETLKKGRVKITFQVFDEPDFTPIYDIEETLSTTYMTLNQAVSRLNMSRKFFSRITGSMLVIMGGKRNCVDDAPKQNIGLNLKFSKKNIEIPGYTKRDYTWLYSQKAIDLVEEYQEAFPKLFKLLERGSESDIYYEYELFPDDNGSGESIKKIVNWLKSRPYYSVAKQPCGIQSLEPDVIKELEKHIDNYCDNEQSFKSVGFQVRPHLLYKTGLLVGNVVPDTKATYQLYDRVVNIRESYTVPFGAVGTIIAISISPSGKPDDIMYTVLFDKPFPGGLALNCSPYRGYKMSRLSLINRTHGVRELEAKTGKPGNLMKKIRYIPPHQRQLSQENQNSAFASWTHGGQQSSQHSHNMRQNYNPNHNSSNKGNSASQSRSEKKKMVQDSKVDFMPGFMKPNPTHSGENIRILERPPVVSQTSTFENKITVDDLFSHASKQLQQSGMTPTKPPQMLQFPAPPVIPPTKTSYCLQLLNEYHNRNLGCPMYQYFFDPDTNFCQAQVKIPHTNEPVFGSPSPSKEEAGESVAENALKKLKSSVPIQTVSSALQMQFPAPPVQWCIPNNNQPRLPNPHSQQFVTSLQQQQLQQQQFQQHLRQLQQVSQVQYNQRPPAPPRNSSQSNQQQNKMPFVPLQAEKQQRINRNTSNSQQGANKKSGKDLDKDDKRGAQQEQQLQKGENKEDGGDLKKRRRERKSRIAANFSVKP